MAKTATKLKAFQKIPMSGNVQDGLLKWVKRKMFYDFPVVFILKQHLYGIAEKVGTWAAFYVSLSVSAVYSWGRTPRSAGIS